MVTVTRDQWISKWMGISNNHLENRSTWNNPTVKYKYELDNKDTKWHRCLPQVIWNRPYSTGVHNIQVRLWGSNCFLCDEKLKNVTNYRTNRFNSIFVWHRYILSSSTCKVWQSGGWKMVVSRTTEHTVHVKLLSHVVSTLHLDCVWQQDQPCHKKCVKPSLRVTN